VEPEAELLAHLPHADVLREDLRDDPLEAPVAPHVEEPRQEREAESLSLHRVAYQRGELRVATPAQADEARHRDDLAAVFGDQRHLAVVVDEAEAREPLVSDERVQGMNPA
jgi:hypothetical protein